MARARLIALLASTVLAACAPDSSLTTPVPQELREVSAPAIPALDAARRALIAMDYDVFLRSERAGALSAQRSQVDAGLVAADVLLAPVALVFGNIVLLNPSNSTNLCVLVTSLGPERSLVRVRYFLNTRPRLDEDVLGRFWLALGRQGVVVTDTPPSAPADHDRK